MTYFHTKPIVNQDAEEELTDDGNEVDEEELEEDTEEEE